MYNLNLVVIKVSLPSSALQEVQKRFPDGLPLLDPIDDMGIKDPSLKKVIQKVEAFEHRMYSHPLHSDPNLESVYSLCEKKAVVRIAAPCPNTLQTLNIYGIIQTQCWSFTLFLFIFFDQSYSSKLKLTFICYSLEYRSVKRSDQEERRDIYRASPVDMSQNSRLQDRSI